MVVVIYVCSGSFGRGWFSLLLCYVVIRNVLLMMLIFVNEVIFVSMLLFSCVVLFGVV